MNKMKLLGIMAEKGTSQRKLASVLGISKNTLNSKINGKGCFDTHQAAQICEFLEITDDATKAQIFFENIVPK